MNNEDVMDANLTRIAELERENAQLRARDFREDVRAALCVAASEEDPVWSGRTIMRATDIVCQAIMRAQELS